jgi:hypothetical protein
LFFKTPKYAASGQLGQKRGLDQIEICASYPLSLPRLRSSHNPNNSALPRSMVEIDQEIARVAQIKADAKTQ